jgi:hypothetical protein
MWLIVSSLSLRQSHSFLGNEVKLSRYTIRAQRERGAINHKLNPWRQYPTVHHRIHNSSPRSVSWSSRIHSIPRKSPQDSFRYNPRIYTLVFWSVSFYRNSTPKRCTVFIPLLCVPHYTLTWSAYWYLGMGTNYVPNLINIFRSLGCAKQSVLLQAWWGVVSPPSNPQAGGPPAVGCLRLLIQYVRSYPLHLEAVSSIRDQRTRHAVVTADPPNMLRSHNSYSFLTTALYGGEWLASRPGCALPAGRNHGTYCTGGWMSPRAGLDRGTSGKISCLCRGSNLDCPVLPSAARHYTDWATPALFPLQ